MKGLLLKDIFTLEKQMRLLLIVMVIFAIVPASTMIGFAIMYSIILPMSTFGYDERAKWDHLLRVMPIKGKTVVLSKYVLGYGFIIMNGTIILLAQFLYHAFGYQNLSLDVYPVFALNVFMMMASTLFAYAIIMPFIFKLGMEKGRLIFGAIFALLIIMTTVPFSMMQISASYGEFLVSPLFALLIILLSVSVNFLSIKISEKFYLQQHVT